MIDAGTRFQTPEQVLLDPQLSAAEKRALLQSWVCDERQIAVAVEEGMPGSDPPLLWRVVVALAALEERA